MDFPFRGLTALTEGDDLTLANLEVVLSGRSLKKEKKKFNFLGKPEYTEILRLGSIECVTVANNHTHDYGNEGYADTKAVLDEAGIAWLGTDAPAVWRSDDGLAIGFLGVNYSLTGNRFRRYEQQAQLLRDQGCSVLITIMHAGTEYSTNPPDNYQAQIVQHAFGRSLVDHSGSRGQLGTCVSGVRRNGRLELTDRSTHPALDDAVTEIFLLADLHALLCGLDIRQISSPPLRILQKYRTSF